MVLLSPIIGQRHEIEKLIEAEASIMVPADVIESEQCYIRLYIWRSCPRVFTKVVECSPSRPVSYKKGGQMRRLKGPGAWWQSDCQQLSEDQIIPSSFDQTMKVILQRSL